MIVVTDLLMNAWYQLLNGNVVVDGGVIPVYKTDVPIDEKGNYLIISEESEIEVPIKSTRWTKPVILVESVTRSGNSFRADINNKIDNAVTLLYAPGDLNNLPAAVGIQITNVFKQNIASLKERTSSEYIFRKITRYTHDIFQN